MKRKLGLSTDHRAVLLNDLEQMVVNAEDVLKLSVGSTRTAAAHNVALRAAIGKLKRAKTLIEAL